MLPWDIGTITEPVDSVKACSALFEYGPSEIAAKSDGLTAVLKNQPSLLFDDQEPPGYYAAVQRLAPAATAKALGYRHWIHLEKPVGSRAPLRAFLRAL